MKSDIFLNDLKIEEIKDEKNSNLSSFVFNNLPNELAITIGNYYRRIILSYMSGISIFGIKISNRKDKIMSEFSTLEGLVETPPYLILNLKKIVFSLKKDCSLFNNETFEFEIDINNDSDDEYTVKSSDIRDLSGKVEILNPDVYLATISPFSSLNIRMYCKNSWGFRKNKIEDIQGDFGDDLIMIDSNHNPVIDTSYKIDFIVTGLEKQDEKLILKIETNGSLSPREILINALEISLDFNKSFFDSLKKGDD